MACTLTQGALTDILVVTMGSDASTINPSTLLSFSIGNVRTPPSVAAMTGFTVATASTDGYTIDQNAKPVSY